MIQFPDSKYLTENDTFRYMVNKSKKKAYHIWEKLRILYSEPHRFYHTGRHVQHLIDLINAEKNLRKDQQEILYIVSFFHDAIYNPSKSYNEEASCDLFCGMLKKTNRFLTCIKMIEDTKTHQPRSKLSKLFCEFDLWTLIHGTFLDLLENERLIFKEYQFCSYYKYKQSRHDFLSKIKLHPMVTKNSENINTLMFYNSQYVPNVGLYAGSFNPVHIGHRNIIKKAEKIFDKVIIAAGINSEKKIDPNHIITIKNNFPYHQVEYFYGMLTNFIKELKYSQKITLIRGLRNGYDFNYEINQLRFMEDMMRNTFPVVFIPCDREVDYISSSAIRGIEKIDNNYSARYL